MESCSSLGLRSGSRASPSTWSNGEGRPARDGGPSCMTTRRTLPPWTCSLFRPSVSTAFVIVRLGRRDLVWDQRHSIPDRRLGRATDHGGIPLERGSTLHDPRPRSDLRHRRHTPTACHGHPRQAYRTGFTLAEWLC